MCGQHTSIDGQGGILGAAGPRHYRPNVGIPITGQMHFNSADVRRANVNLLGIILHEMGHVLGLGTMWVTRSLTNGYSPPCSYKENSAASLEYRSISGCNGKAIPLEQSFSGQGSNCGHWEERCFGREIMTPSANPTLPISRITVAGLADLGYQVSFGSAESYGSNELLSCCSSRRRLRRENNSTIPITSQEQEDDEEDISSPRKYRQLSEEGLRVATDFGKELLEENRHATTLHPGDDVPDLGGEVIVVLCEEADGSIHSIMVRNDS